MFSYRNSPWDLFDALTRSFDDFGRLGLNARNEHPAVNVWTDEDSVAISAELPGVKPDDLNVDVEGDTLTITGKREIEVPEGARVLRRERGAFDFTRSVRLPFPVETKKAEARFRNGVLLIVLKRQAADKPKRIAIKAA